jgi:hypothetical protein
MKKLENTYQEIIIEQQILKTTRGKLLSSAIINRNPVTFWYTGPRAQTKAGRRINAEVVSLGVSKKGNLIIRAWVQPPSASKTGFEEDGWRTFIVGRMSNITVADDTFDEKRPGYKEGDESTSGPMARTYVTSKWGDEVEQPQTTEPQTTEPQTTEPEVTSKSSASLEPNELPQPNKSTSPQPTVDIKPSRKDIETDGLTHGEPVSVEPEKLPQPKPVIKPPSIPDEESDDEINDDDENNIELQENLKRIKQLLYY